MRKRFTPMLRSLAILAMTAAPIAPALACGLEGNDIAVQRSALNWAFPGSLHVLGAVSGAQRAGLLPTPRVDSSAPVVTGGPLALARVNAELWKLNARLAAPGAATPDFAIVLIESMLWSRVTAADGTSTLSVHVDGPRAGDVVLVTEQAVVSALVDGSLSLHTAIALGVVKFYGASARVDAVLARFGPFGGSAADNSGRPMS